MQNGTCIVNITTENMAGTTSQSCQFSPKNLVLFSDQQAALDIQNPMMVNRAVINQVLQNECKNSDENKIATSKAAYFKALQACRPGIYQVITPSIGTNLAATFGQQVVTNQTMITTYKIIGQQADHCVTEISVPGLPVSHCAYSKETIDFIIKKGNQPPQPVKPGTNSFANISQEVMQQTMTMMQECGMLPNGLK